MGKRAKDVLRFETGREVFDGLLIGLALLLFITIIVSLVFLDAKQEAYLGIRKEGFRMAACWVLLMAICLASDHLRNWRSLVLGLSVALGAAIQYTLYYAVRAQGAQYTNFELAMSVFSVYFTLPTFMVLLVSTKVDNLSSEMEKERFRSQKLTAELGRLAEMLKKSKETKAQVDDGDDETSLARRKLILSNLTAVYSKLFRVRARDGAAALLEELFNEKLGFDEGFILEVPDEGRETKVRNLWGRELTSEKGSKLLLEWKDREITGWVMDRREPLDPEKMRRLPKLADALERFTTELFPLEHVLAVVSLNRAVQIIYLGPQAHDAPLAYDYSLVEPILGGLGLVQAKQGRTGQTRGAQAR